VERARILRDMTVGVQRNQRENPINPACKVTPENWKKMQKFGE
jgi:hypothetical protein